MGAKTRGKVAVITFPGSNCDRDMVSVLRDTFKVDAQLVWHEDPLPKDLVGIVLPGGFTYGDRLRSGAIASHSPVIKKIKKFAEEGMPILGVCNGFQILTEAQILPGALIRNESVAFECARVEMEVKNNKTPFTSELKVGERVPISIANGEGRYYIDSQGLEALKKNNQIVFSYIDHSNGSIENIAGVCNEKGNVVGLMPHPERAADAILNPGKNLPASLIFKSFLKAIRKK
ncbi:MAG: phosphoribosylformylglycinamidine synthase subunit PurQ [Candidatus Micrarchaeota archaeon]|nr:phosphoribosylformylglycinamidine synthase subunit PurQ [Candidatus Micrarchaeota archaeon]